LTIQINNIFIYYIYYLEKKINYLDYKLNLNNWFIFIEFCKNGKVFWINKQFENWFTRFYIKNFRYCKNNIKKINFGLLIFIY